MDYRHVSSAGSPPTSPSYHRSPPPSSTSRPLSDPLSPSSATTHPSQAAVQQTLRQTGPVGLTAAPSVPGLHGPAAISSSSRSRAEAVEDLCDLVVGEKGMIADDAVLATLRERYLAGKCYTRMSHAALIAMNPHRPMEVQDGKEALRGYCRRGWWDVPAADEEDDEESGGAHMYALAADAYYHMRRTGQDQSIVISGESGSGKSESARLAFRLLVQLSVAGQGKKGGKLAAQVPSAQYILETFGHARTSRSENASRVGKYVELQFTDRGRLAGAKTLAYYLEKTRCSTLPPPGERNFHAFYYLVAGASAEERQHLMLGGDPAAYRYLGGRQPHHLMALGGNHHQSGVVAGSDEDATRFEQLKAAFKAVGLSKRLVAQVCQLLAAILHLGNIDFVIDRGRNEEAAVVRDVDALETVAEFLAVSSSTLEATLSYRSRMIKRELCTVCLDSEGAAANRDELARTLYSLLFTWLNEYLNQKLCRDDFDSFVGILDLPGPQNVAGAGGARANSLDQLCVNYAQERLQNWVQRKIFTQRTFELQQEGLSSVSPPIPFFDNSECLRVLDHQPGGLIHIADDQARKQPKKNEHTMVEAFGKRWANHSSFKLGSIDRSGFPTFTVSHYTGVVTYSTESLLEKNADTINPDFVSLLRGGIIDDPRAAAQNPGSSNPFIQGLFTGRSIVSEAHPKDDETIVAAQQPVKPLRAPSTRRKNGKPRRLASVGEEGEEGEDEGAVGGGNDEAPVRGIKCVLGEYRASLDTLFKALDETQPWFAFCLNPNDARLPNQVETRGLRAQIRSYGLSEMTRKLATTFEVSMTHAEGCERYAAELNAHGILHGGVTNAAVSMRSLAKARGLGERDMSVGKHKVFLSHRAFHAFEDALRRQEPQDAYGRGEDVLELDPFSPFHARALSANPSAVGAAAAVVPLHSNESRAALIEPATQYADDGYEPDTKTLNYSQGRSASRYADTASFVGTEAYAPSRNMFSNLDKKGLAYNEKDPYEEDIGPSEVVEEIKETPGRRRWVFLTNALTWWIPGFLLRWLGGLKRPDIRQAWREKLTINLIIWFICGCAVFVIAVLGNLICPREYVYSSSELASHSYNNDPSNTYVAIRGEVFDLSSLAPNHLTAVSVVPTKSVMKYGGLDASDIFPVQVSALCDGTDGSVSPWVTLDTTNTSDVNAQYHDFRAYTNDSRPDWYYEQMVYMRYRYRVGFMGYTTKEVKSMASAGRAVAIYNGLVYELTTYISQGGGGIRPPNGYNAPADTNRQFMSQNVVTVFQQSAGQDVTNLIDGLSSSIGSDVLARQKTCLRNLFVIGKVDHRNSPACLFSTYILLALSIVMVAIIGFKFLGALHFSSKRAPENHDKFVICQVPCYTEGEDSLRKTIDSLAKLKYDDKRKLLLVVCDGNIIGSGNDRPTPRIVLDILGVDPNQDAEALSFLSLGEGAKQHNMGKVYSGLYECAGHVVPYLVVVKVGKPSERQRPGNRGKRDSQMLVMHFLNKVHFDSPMNPLELEMFHQVKNVIGVNPTFYEYIFTVDADTTVDDMSLNRMVSHMVHDKKTIAVCGETELANAKQSIITMMQVYEYFISHHLAKSFESLFGTITCLPGCFSMYRLRTPDTHKPLFISNQIIEGYSENRVDTLHMKNLLHLGEDRYLTTLILKHFSNYKTKFVRDAHAYTVAPDDWKVLLSQRRRWINSTVHNMTELVQQDGLCGFCCFSMRFIVLIDLLSTVIAPVTVAYIVYLIYLVAAKGETIPTFSIIMLAAIYGLQALIFIFRLRWDMIAWMIFYILAIPVFSFLLPLYSFWKMDDFSWGSTRVVLNDKGSKVVIHDEGKFDPRVIPLKSWNEYENELWDQESNHSIGSWVPPSRKQQQQQQQYENGGGEYADSRAQSMYGRETVYDGGAGGGGGGDYEKQDYPYPSYPGAPSSERRGISPSPSYQRVAHSRSPSGYGQPPQQYPLPTLDYGNGGGGGVVGGYGSQPASPPRRNAGSGIAPPRSSMYALHTGHQSQMTFNPYMDNNISAVGRTPPSFLPDPLTASPSTRGLGGGGGGTLAFADTIPSTDLEREIRRIVLDQGADLDSLTKKGVRRELERSFGGVELSRRKEEINALIEKVLTE